MNFTNIQVYKTKLKLDPKIKKIIFANIKYTSQKLKEIL